MKGTANVEERNSSFNDTIMNFEQAAEKVKNLKKTPPDDVFLKCYGLYKQATVGKINITKPATNDEKGKAKFKAWQKNADMTQEQAKQEYIKLAEELIKKYGVKEGK